MKSIRHTSHIVASAIQPAGVERIPTPLVGVEVTMSTEIMAKTHYSEGPRLSGKIVALLA
ncbi:hypothetical protein G5645_20120 [Pectobacterium carotovorum]|nr:hypothetical protein [Pectobacterium carotovorum]MBL0910316.1 hypothetical protein [Pectobacterium carotovorum]